MFLTERSDKLKKMFCHRLCQCLMNHVALVTVFKWGPDHHYVDLSIGCILGDIVTRDWSAAGNELPSWVVSPVNSSRGRFFFGTTKPRDEWALNEEFNTVKFVSCARVTGLSLSSNVLLSTEVTAIHCRICPRKSIVGNAYRRCCCTIIYASHLLAQSPIND